MASGEKSFGYLAFAEFACRLMRLKIFQLCAPDFIIYHLNGTFLPTFASIP
jgi:hypothetical protein